MHYKQVARWLVPGLLKRPLTPEQESQVKRELSESAQRVMDELSVKAFFEKTELELVEEMLVSPNPLHQRFLIILNRKFEQHLREYLDNPEAKLTIHPEMVA